MSPGMRGKARCSRLLHEQVGNENVPMARPSGETHGTALAAIHRNLLDLKMDLTKVIQEPVRGSRPKTPSGTSRCCEQVSRDVPVHSPAIS